jgi:hypothetical protein
MQIESLSDTLRGMYAEESRVAIQETIRGYLETPKCVSG